ncbi:hypothetical protein [Nostoc sp. PCC 7107]|uniref:hypothetical protein n=1 Tax=Nostoc sp. PCC 7107 TaxID=317936 RepID=UPI00029F076E|nr:hypothetical protein [Nostoc sp. PCC 7107]AFY43919.1 hypothetical protein Nos7107_3339 [Nostoc sp. PCC 7107]
MSLTTTQSYMESTLTLQTALTASKKTVDIQIAPDDLNTLKGSDYKLCFAKKVGDNDYNVVWQSFTAYLSNNSFLWTPQYQLFGSNIFQSNIEVKVSTNTIKIGLGEQSILSKAGLLQPPSTGGEPTGFTLKNEFGNIHPGVNQMSFNTITGKEVSTPIYVAQNPVVIGDTLLTPVEKVLVWFEQNIETSTMFSNSRSKSVEIDLTQDNSATRLYKNGSWITP